MLIENCRIDSHILFWISRLVVTKERISYSRLRSVFDRCKVAFIQIEPYSSLCIGSSQITVVLCKFVRYQNQLADPCHGARLNALVEMVVRSHISELTMYCEINQHPAFDLHC
jgi:hypothetical protein